MFLDELYCFPVQSLEESVCLGLVLERIMTLSCFLLLKETLFTSIVDLEEN